MSLLVIIMWSFILSPLSYFSYSENFTEGLFVLLTWNKGSKEFLSHVESSENHSGDRTNHVMSFSISVVKVFVVNLFYVLL